jgi:predicted outer membrane repeat protein
MVTGIFSGNKESSERKEMQHAIQRMNSVLRPLARRRALPAVTALCLGLTALLGAGCGDSSEPEPFGPMIWLVEPTGLGNYRTVQGCIDDARDGDTCGVLPGVYNENIRFYGKQISVVSTHGPEQTVLDGGLRGTVVQFVDNEPEGTHLYGFTIVNGKASAPTPETPAWDSSRAFASEYPGYENGGGIKIWTASPLIQNCIIRNNEADGDGGGIYCAFTGAQPHLDRIIFHENSAGGLGGGLHVFSSIVDLTNLLFTGNSAESGGAIGAGFGARLTLSNCTLADNFSAAGSNAEALYLFNSSAAWLDSIIGNKSWTGQPDKPLVVLDLNLDQPPQPGVSPSLSFTMDYSDLEGGVQNIVQTGDCISNPDLCFPESTNPVDGDPLFLSRAGAEDNPRQAYYLSQTAGGQVTDSPCLDAGSRTAEQALMNTSTTQNGENGNQLPDEGTVDLGYHYLIAFP